MIDPQMDADLRAAVDDRMAARIEQARERRAAREQDRAAKLARRTAGLRARHATKLARLDAQDDEDDTATALGRGLARTDTTTPARARVRGDRTPMTDDTTPPGTVDENGVPLQRKGRRCGWEGKDRYDFGATRLRVALTDLARDGDPAARLTGMQISAEVADLLHEFATRADNATTRARRAKAAVDRLRPLVDERLRQARNGRRETP